jgi:hypothetical protein
VAAFDEDLHFKGIFTCEQGANDLDLVPRRDGLILRRWGRLRQILDDSNVTCLNKRYRIHTNLFSVNILSNIVMLF